MSDAPEVRVLAGSPRPAEEAAVREAIAAILREERARAAPADAPGPWVLTARLEGARGRPGARGPGARGPDAWRGRPARPEARRGDAR